MFSLSSSNIFYLYNQPTDMRKNFDGLSVLISSKMGKNPTSGEVFIFINKTKDRVKLLHWETHGFTLYYKRLEAGTIEWPKSSDLKMKLNWSDLVMIIEGISLESVKKRKRYVLEKNV